MQAINNKRTRFKIHVYQTGLIGTTNMQKALLSALACCHNLGEIIAAAGL